MARKKRPASQPARPTMDDDPVVKGLLRAISLKRLRPGTKLVADQLVEAFGSNRIHIRQVFEHLGSRGIIRLHPNRGAFVAQPTAEEARQIFATRRILERAAVSDLVDKLDDQTTRALQAHMRREQAHPQKDRWNTLALTGEFHGLIARLAGNAVLAKFIEELVLRTSLIIATFESHDSEDCSPHAHPMIAGLIIARDRQEAATAMDTHLRAMEDRLDFDAPAEETKDLVSILADLGVNRRRARNAAE